MQHCRGFSEGNGRVPLPNALRAQVGGKVDLWYFQSPKNRRRFVLCGELLFLLAITLESDRHIVSYEPYEFDDEDGPAATDRPHLRALDVTGKQIDYITIRTRNPRKATKPLLKQRDLNGVTIITDEWLYDRRVLLDNWIFLCAALNRVRHSPWQLEAAAMHDLLQLAGSCTLDSLLALPNFDPARMLGAVADALQRGTANCDTCKSLFSLSSQIFPGGPSWHIHA